MSIRTILSKLENELGGSNPFDNGTYTGSFCVNVSKETTTSYMMTERATGEMYEIPSELEATYLRSKSYNNKGYQDIVVHIGEPRLETTEVTT